MNAVRALILRAVVRAIKPKAALTVSEWSDAHRVLVEGADPEPGPWKTSRNPPTREIMDQLSEHSPATKVVFMGPTQFAKTAISTNFLGYIIAHAKGSVAVFMPTENTLSDWNAQKFNPMAENSLVVREALAKKSSGENNARRKSYIGGSLFFRTAGSSADLKNISLRYAIVDEVDEYVQDTGQGDPVGLIEARMSAYPDAKIYIVSTPTKKDVSHIEEQFEGGDQRRYHVPCPHCGVFQIFKQPNLRWQKADGLDTRVRQAWYSCEENGCSIEEHHKPEMLARGRWIPDAPGAPYPSYHINALYSPIGLGRTWKQLAEEFLESHSDPVKLMRYMNTRLAEPFADQTSDLKGNVLMARAEPYALRTVPHGCLLITVGADVQSGAGSRLEMTVLGHGRGDKTWVLDYHTIPGNLTDDATWAAFAAYVNAVEFRNAGGHTLRSEACAIDTGGHFTHEVYAFVRANRIRRPMAVKGASKPGQVILGKPSKQDVNWRGQTIRHGVSLYQVGTDTAKFALYGRLHADEDKPAEQRKVHFSTELDQGYYDGLVAETYNPRKNRWEKKKGKKNEPLDTWVYAVAASHHPEIYLHKWRAADWDRRAAMVEPVHVEIELGSQDQAAPEEPAHTTPRTGARKTQHKVRPAKGFVRGYK